MPLGVYEDETCRWLQSVLSPGNVFFDIGANAGYFTLLGSKLVGETGKVVAFEPIPVNVEVVERQLGLNACANAVVEELAVADSVDSLSFDLEDTNANSHLSDVTYSHPASRLSRTLTVRCTTLDAWVEAMGIRPDVMKVDVEGAEERLLLGAHVVLRTARPRIVLSTHSDELNRVCRRLLNAAGYDVVALPGFEHELLAYPRSI